eukprot:Ihof_evm1s268 gene=Ihof_evmTU1s268
MLASGIGIAGAALQVFGGCCTQAIAMETVISRQPTSGMLVTFAQFVFTSGISLAKWYLIGCPYPRIPLYHYAAMVVIFFLTSSLANVALAYQITLPLQMIFRSGSLVTNMILGIILLGKRYTTSKYIAVVAVSVGVYIFTTASMAGKIDQPVIDNSQSNGTDSQKLFFNWCIGIAMLSSSLILSSTLGIYQEKLYTNYGRHANEGVLFTHILALPLFYFFKESILLEISAFNQSNEIDLAIPFITNHIAVPTIWLWMIFSLLTQYWCISSVFYLTTITTSLNMTLVLTLRKFISLILS